MRVNIYDINEARVEQFRARWKEQRGEDISVDRAVNILIENIAEITETRTLTVTLKEPSPEKKKPLTLRKTSRFATNY